VKKPFPTLGVVGAWSGRLLKDRGFGEIHEVFDHLYPGIMTLGLVAMSQHAAEYLHRTVPGLANFPMVTDENWQEMAELPLRDGASMTCDHAALKRDVIAWSLLPFVGLQRMPGMLLELRNCQCGSTVAVEVPVREEGR